MLADQQTGIRVRKKGGRKLSNLVKVKHLHKEYGKNVVLKDINLSVKKGEVVVIIGPSGCGKSTFLRCLNGLENIDGGVVEIGGLPVEPEKSSIYKLRQKIGMVFHSFTNKGTKKKQRRCDKRGHRAS